MKNNDKKVKGIIILIALACMVISVCVCGEIVGITINILIVLAMAITILFGLNRYKDTGLLALRQATADLNNASGKIKEMAENPETDLLEEISLMDSEQLFTEPMLKDAFNEYKAELDRLYREHQEYRYCDISDYINDDLLNDIARSSMNDLIGGMMTGLGILGTFIGLTFGLQKFKSNTAEEMMETIEPLIDGIKVAFLTSIYGMVASLCFNFYYRFLSRDAADALDGFIQLFYDKIKPRSDNEGFTRLIELQNQQNDSMKQFAEDIALSLSEQLNQTFIPALQGIDQSMQKQSEVLPQAVGQAIGEAIIPAFQTIESSFGDMTERLAKMQDQSMEQVANNFVTHMDEAMGNQMTRLGESLEKICDWQETMSEKMQSMADEMVTSGERLVGINSTLNESAEKFKGYIEQLDTAQTSLTEYYGQIMSNCKSISEMTEEQNRALQETIEKSKEVVKTVSVISAAFDEQIAAINESLNDASGEISDSLKKQEREISDAMKEQLATAASLYSEYSEQIRRDAEMTRRIENSFTENTSNVVAAFNESSKVLQQSSKDLSQNLDSAMSRTFKQIDTELAEIVSHLSGTIIEIKETTERIPKTVALSNKQAAVQTEQYLEQVKKAIQDLNKTVLALDSQWNTIFKEQQKAANARR